MQRKIKWGEVEVEVWFLVLALLMIGMMCERVADIGVNRVRGKKPQGKGPQGKEPQGKERQGCGG